MPLPASGRAKRCDGSTLDVICEKTIIHTFLLRDTTLAMPTKVLLGCAKRMGLTRQPFVDGT